MRPFPNCAVLRSNKQQVYYIESHCLNKQTGIITNWMPLLEVAAEEMRLRGLEIVMKDLKEFESRDSDLRSIPNSQTPEGRREAKRQRESVPVSVNLLANGTLLFTPQAKWSRSAWVAISDSSTSLTQRCAPDEFFQALEMTFSRCVSSTPN